jgi:hypothetical protein
MGLYNELLLLWLQRFTIECICNVTTQIIIRVTAIKKRGCFKKNTLFMNPIEGELSFHTRELFDLRTTSSFVGFGYTVNPTTIPFSPDDSAISSYESL